MYLLKHPPSHRICCEDFPLLKINEIHFQTLVLFPVLLKHTTILKHLED